MTKKGFQQVPQTEAEHIVLEKNESKWK